MRSSAGPTDQPCQDPIRNASIRKNTEALAIVRECEKETLIRFHTIDYDRVRVNANECEIREMQGTGT